MDHLSQFIIHHWELWAILVVLLIFTFINEYFIKIKSAKTLSPQAAVVLLNQEKAVVIDLRDKDIYQKGHIIHAVHAKEEDFEQTKMDKYKSHTLIIICPAQIKPEALAVKLQKKGFDIAILAGGISAWQNADLPLVKGK